MILCGAGFNISYQLSLHSIYLQQRELILHSGNFKNTIVKFSFPLNYAQVKNPDVIFVEEDEIMFNGKMYDIVNQRISDDSIFITCIPDKIEDEVRDQVNNQFNKTEGATTQKNFSAFKFNPGPFLFQSESWNLHFTTDPVSVNFLFIKNGKAVASFLSVPFPPPWTV